MKPITRKKINNAIVLLQKYEKLALQLNSDGFFLAFSGGKDSQLLYLIAELSGVKFKAYYSNTTNDAVENVRFIREKYPNVTFLIPKENFYKLVAKKGLPTTKKRYCCAILKEQAGAGYAVLTGERKEESAKRRKYTSVVIQSRNEKRAKIISENEIVKHECIKGRDKLRIRPILEFTENEVWEILKHYNIPKNPCYNTQSRIGCILCPFAPKKQIEDYLQRYPRIKRNILKSLQTFLDSKEGFFTDAEECFDWWLSKKSVAEWKANKKQTTIEFYQE